MRNNIVITGVSSGVGLSLVRHLSDGFMVIAVGRRLERFHEEFGNNSHVRSYHLDLSDTGQVDRVFTSIIDDHGFIPCLINNAGINIKALTEELEEQQIFESLTVNAVSPLLIIKKLLPAMRQHNFGRVINITSGAPFNCFPGFAAYSASKAALNAFTITAAKEHASYNIKINLMSPGPVRTNMAPDAKMDPSVCHPTVDYLLSLDEKGPTGRFFWLGYEIPLFPDLEGIKWLEGTADQRFRKVI